jgi:type II secretory pathway component PulM
MTGMRDWMAGLSASERVLIALAAALALVLGGSLLVLAPLRDGYADARDDYAAAARALREARDGAMLAEQGGSSGPAEADVRAAAMSTAVARGVSIARLNPVEDGGLSVRLERVEPALLYSWLADLELAHGVGVRRATVRRTQGAESVEADIVLAGGTR